MEAAPVSRKDETWGPVLAMLAVNTAFAVMNILVEKSLDKGMDCLVLITFRQIVAAAFLVPIAYFKERKSRPDLTWWISLQLLLSALFGAFLTQYFFFVGLKNTNATFACSFLNMAPVFTFLLALPLRQETLDLRNTSGKAKLAATVASISGVVVLMLYKGPRVDRITHAATNIDEAAATSSHGINGSAMRWTIGSLAVLGASVCWSLWFLMQARIGKQYPATYSSTTIMFFFASLQAASLALATTHHQGAAVWVRSLTGRLHVITLVYAGVVGSGACFLVMSWCIRKRGPVFTVAFSPLVQVIVAMIDFALTRQPPLLGSVLGSVLVVIGLYLLLWGKSKEAECYQGKSIQQARLKDSATTTSSIDRT